MKPYIEGNNTLRKAASNGVTQFFGKTMENVRTGMNLHLTTDHDNAVKWFSRLDFKRNAHTNGLYLIEAHKHEIVYDKPVYVGCGSRFKQTTYDECSL